MYFSVLWGHSHVLGGMELASKLCEHTQFIVRLVVDYYLSAKIKISSVKNLTQLVKTATGKKHTLP